MAVAVRGLPCGEQESSDNVAPLPAALTFDEADACFIVRGANGQALAYVYYEQEPAARGGVGAATAASLPRALIMASSLPPCAVHHSSSSIEAFGAF